MVGGVPHASTKINSPKYIMVTPKTPKYSHVTNHSDYINVKEKQNPSIRTQEKYSAKNNKEVRGAERRRWWFLKAPAYGLSGVDSHALVSRGKRYVTWRNLNTHWLNTKPARGRDTQVI
ncbi:hypothetical protein E2C01_024442 [Portunus trituberculatus]|uniref:Uncharacterized protein n=1 Tax=Portunus trituberculatus TaxID=210409 RepID=A0A5B7EDU1_PORTR|nr:hypothetical protein [Portunus trituberculatus]